MTDRSQIEHITTQAVAAALSQNWQLAIELNKQILSLEAENIQALNRLGFAFIQSGNLPQAKKTYKQVLELDKYNPIATKSYDKLLKLKSSQITNSGPRSTMFASFLEEPGKTKTVPLLRPATSNIFYQLSAGIPLQMTPKKRRVSVETFEGEYIGCLPDDIGFRIAKLMEIGYKYDTFIKGISNKHITVFIKETFRSKKGNNLPSFPHSGGSMIGSIGNALEPSEVVPVDVTPTGEEENYQE